MSSLTSLWERIRGFYEGRNEPENVRPLAQWFWSAILSFSVIATGAIVAFGTWEFIEVLQKLTAGDSLNRTSPPEVINRRDLQGFLDSYEDRKNDFVNAKSNASGVSDPSR